LLGRREQLSGVLIDQINICKREYRRFRPQFIAVERLLNQTALFQTLQRSVDPVMIVKPVSPKGVDKLGRAAGAIALSAAGRVFLPEPSAAPDFPVEDVLAELVSFTGEGKKGTRDDAVDCLSYSCDMLTFVRPGWSGGSAKAPFRHTTKNYF
jgi:phage terminase large subunit-like protein